jgi:dTDP-4-amino-4,6-dideoxygalactose transaminase
MWRSLAARLARGAYLRDADASVDAAVEEFYLEGLKSAEAFLDQHPTCTDVPQVILDQLAGLDWRETAIRRRANWQHLHELLSGKVEVLMHELPDEVVPLGYVVCLGERERVRARLAAQRIFCPVHWPLPAEVERARFPAALALSETCLTLPIDQRYDAAEMERLAAALLAAL